MSTFTPVQLNDRARRILKREDPGIFFDHLPLDIQRAWRDEARLSLEAEARVWREGGTFLSPGYPTGTTAKCGRCSGRVDLNGPHRVEVVVSEGLGTMAVHTHIACGHGEG